MSRAIKLVSVNTAIFVLVVLIFSFYYYFSGKLALNASLDQLIGKQIGVTYKVENIKYEIGTDLSALWLIEINQEVSDLKNASSKFGKADKTDRDRFIKYVSRMHNTGSSLNQSELYIGEIPLGKNTICEELPCNIYILKNSGNSKWVVKISKN